MGEVTPGALLVLALALRQGSYGAASSERDQAPCAGAFLK
jgi:hypothetical protein